MFQVSGGGGGAYATGLIKNPKAGSKITVLVGEAGVAAKSQYNGNNLVNANKKAFPDGGESTNRMCTKPGANYFSPGGGGGSTQLLHDNNLAAVAGGGGGGCAYLDTVKPIYHGSTGTLPVAGGEVTTPTDVPFAAKCWNPNTFERFSIGGSGGGYPVAKTSASNTASVGGRGGACYFNSSALLVTPKATVGFEDVSAVGFQELTAFLPVIVSNLVGYGGKTGQNAQHGFAYISVSKNLQQAPKYGLEALKLGSQDCVCGWYHATDIGKCEVPVKACVSNQTRTSLEAAKPGLCSSDNRVYPEALDYKIRAVVGSWDTCSVG